MATHITLNDGSFVKLHLGNPDCRRARECVCGFCKGVDANGMQAQCERADCRNRAIGACARFGYPICATCMVRQSRVHSAAYAEIVTEAIDWTSDCLNYSAGRRASAESAIRYVVANYPGGWRAFALEIRNAVQL